MFAGTSRHSAVRGSAESVQGPGTSAISPAWSRPGVPAAERQNASANAVNASLAAAQRGERLSQSSYGAPQLERISTLQAASGPTRPPPAPPRSGSHPAGPRHPHQRRGIPRGGSGCPPAVPGRLHDGRSACRLPLASGPSHRWQHLARTGAHQGPRRRAGRCRALAAAEALSRSAGPCPAPCSSSATTLGREPSRGPSRGREPEFPHFLRSWTTLAQLPRALENAPAGGPLQPPNYPRHFAGAPVGSPCASPRKSRGFRPVDSTLALRADLDQPEQRREPWRT
jgi:hypothetical protein